LLKINEVIQKKRFYVVFFVVFGYFLTNKIFINRGSRNYRRNLSIKLKKELKFMFTWPKLFNLIIYLREET